MSDENRKYEENGIEWMKKKWNEEKEENKEREVLRKGH